MPDRERGDSRSGSPELDFSGLLPGDDQPRRRRRRPATEPPERETGEEERRASREPQEAVAPEAEVPEEAPGGVDTPAAPPELAPEAEAGEGQPDEPDSAGSGVGESEVRAATERRAVPASGAPEARSGAPPVSAAPGPPEEPAAVTEAGETALQEPHGHSAESGEEGRAEDTGDPLDSPDATEVAARRAAREAQALLVDGDDLERRLERIRSYTPAQRSAYKTSIGFSEEHYELAMDLRKEFRRRGFTGNDATMANVISLALEVVSEALEAEKNLPGAEPVRRGRR